MLQDCTESAQPGCITSNLVAGAARLAAQALHSQDGLNIKLESPAGPIRVLHAVITAFSSLRPSWQQIAADEIANAGVQSGKIYCRCADAQACCDAWSNT